MLAQKLTAQIGQPVVFESRPGANGQIAANYLKTLPPDGYNILYTASSTVVTGPLMSKSVGFDTFKDFTPISQAVGAPLYLVANSELGVDTTAGLIEYAKKNPGKLNYGSVGRGSVFHFQGEAMKVAAGIDMLHVPYTGANNANIIGDLLANRVQVYFPAYPATLAALPTGKIKLLGMFFDQRTKQRPDLPTVKEALPNLITVPSWFGFMGPAGLPAPIVDAPPDRNSQGAAGSGDLQEARRGRHRPGRQHRRGNGEPAAQPDRRTGPPRQAGRHPAGLACASHGLRLYQSARPNRYDDVSVSLEADMKRPTRSAGKTGKKPRPKKPRAKKAAAPALVLSAESDLAWPAGTDRRA